MVYEECYSKVKGMGGLFQTSERSKRAYIRARVCSGGCDYDTGLAHEGHVISISWTKDHGRCHSRGLPLTPLPVLFHCLPSLSSSFPPFAFCSYHSLQLAKTLLLLFVEHILKNNSQSWVFFLLPYLL